MRSSAERTRISVSVSTLEVASSRIRMRGIVRQGAGEVDELLLPGGKALPAFAHRLVEAVRQRADKVEHVDLIGRALHAAHP